MNERKLTGGDIYFDGLKFVRNSSFSESVCQTIKTVLSSFEGEVFTDRNSGVPWLDGVLGEDSAFTGFAVQSIKDKVVEIPGVKSVDSVNLSVLGRKMVGEVSATLDDGEQVNVEIV